MSTRMRTDGGWRLFGVLMAASVAAVGCSAKGGEKPADVKKAEGPKPAEVKPGTGPAMDDLRLDKMRREDRQAYLAQKFTEMGDDLYASGDWEKARGKYAEVLELDPGNAHAARRMEEIGAHLNERGGSTGSAFASAIEARTVRIEQSKLEVAALVRSARTAEQAGKFKEAIDLYEKALVIVEIQPYQVDFTPDATALRRMIAGAKASGRDADQARRAKEFEQARRVRQAEAAEEKRQQRTKIDTLFRDANAAMETEDYGRAFNLAEDILAIDPTNRDAQRLRTMTLEGRNARTSDAIRRNLREEWKNAFEELQRQAIPQTTDIEFPSTWAVNEGRDRSPRLTTMTDFTSDPREAALTARLDSVRTPLTIDDGQTTIMDLLAHLSDLTGVNIVMDGKAMEGKSDQDLMLPALQLSTPVPVREILSIVTQQRGLGWKVSNGVVLVTTPEEVRGKPLLDLYDVKDITTGVRDFPADDINLQPSGGQGFALPLDDDTEPRRTFEGDQIKELVTNNVDTDVWQDGVSAIDYRDPGTLVVKAPAATHAKIRKLLSDLRNTGGMQVSIETRFITVADNFLQDIGVDLRGLGDDSLGAGVAGKGTNATFDDVLAGSAAAPAGIGTGTDSGVFYNFIHGSQDLRSRVENLYDVALGKPGILTGSGGIAIQATYLDDTQVEAILRAVEKSERSTQVIAPRVTAYNNQRSNVQVLNQVSYISDFDVEIAQLAQIGDPIIQQLRDGIILDIHPVISADKRFITMELRPTVAVLQRPIQTFQTTLANGPPVSIQLPEIRIQRVRTTVTLPDGGTLLLGGLRFYEETRLDSTVPFLDKIPVLNFFWRRQGTFIERRNLLVLLKATIIRLEEHEPRMGRRG